MFLYQLRNVDSEQVFKEISSLNSAGYKIWYDEGIEASTEWPEEN